MTQSDGAGTSHSSITRIVLTGFMGSGKSTVGAVLARSLAWSFFDADTALEDDTGLSIRDLFALRGEPCFRVLEEAAIATLLTREQTVIALGGGALESAQTRSRLAAAPGTHLVFLDAPLAIALTRCGGQAIDRPLLAEHAKLEERYAARLPFYQTAHQTIDTAAIRPEEAAQQIVDAVQGKKDENGRHDSFTDS